MPSNSRYEKVLPSLNTLSLTCSFFDCISPSAEIIPAKNISAIASIMPEPQIPVTPIFAIPSSKSESSDHRSQPMTFIFELRVFGSILTLSIAPGAALCPELI